MAKARLLTKSRFKIGCECPTKLFFTGKPEYGNNNTDNAFLEALAEGGFQVGELAKLYHPGGIEIETLDIAKAVEETSRLLERNDVVLYEPAIRAGDLLVRVDILVKRGARIELIEVKAKSFDPADRGSFYNKSLLKRGITKLSTEWEPYLLDVAFQGYVLKKAFPDWDISHYLMLADKSAQASVDGLNQMFILQQVDGRTRSVAKAGLSEKDLGNQILAKVAVDDEVHIAHGMNFDDGRTFEEHVAFLSQIWTKNVMASPSVGNHCKSCEFRIGSDKKTSGLKSGFEECWAVAQGLKPEEFDKPFVFDIWNFRKSQNLIDDGRIFIEDVKQKDINPASSGNGLSSSERQWLQVEKVINGDHTSFCDAGGLESEFSRFPYPLHFIDFETTMVAIPFHKGCRPYEQIAFQFSHHLVQRDGTVQHKSQYLNRERGKFPNFDFVRELRAALGDSGGTVFRYAAHENTVLCQIRDQLSKSREKDREKLISWIESVTSSKGEESDGWVGPRNMVDLCELVKKYYYHPKTWGSNSIKKVLPAVLSDAKGLHALYSKPIYGAKNGIPSFNFKDWTWLRRDSGGRVIDPYKLLPPVFSDLDLETMDGLLTEGSIADGGAAMTAYARMQFTQMSQMECDRVCAALLKYCELDTFAMVLIYQHWKNRIEHDEGEEAA